MPRSRSAREESFALAEPQWGDLRASVRHYLPQADRLRRIVPILIATFVALAATGLATQLMHGKRTALATAETQLALLADITAKQLEGQSLTSGSTWQSALAASLPRGATADGRIALLADATGDVQARAPFEATPRQGIYRGPLRSQGGHGAPSGAVSAKMRCAAARAATGTIRDRLSLWPPGA